MNYEVYHIPTNFTDAGRIMGLFELRNLVEAVVLTIPVLYLCIAFRCADARGRRLNDWLSIAWRALCV